MAVTSSLGMRAVADANQRIAGPGMHLLCGACFLCVALAFAYLDRAFGRLEVEATIWLAWAVLGFGAGAFWLRRPGQGGNRLALGLTLLAGVLVFMPGLMLYALPRWPAFAVLLMVPARAAAMQRRRDVYLCLMSLVAVSLLTATHPLADSTLWLYLMTGWVLAALALAWDYAMSIRLGSLVKIVMTLGFLVSTALIALTLWVVLPRPDVIGFGFVPAEAGPGGTGRSGAPSNTGGGPGKEAGGTAALGVATKAGQRAMTGSGTQDGGGASPQSGSGGASGANAPQQAAPQAGTRVSPEAGGTGAGAGRGSVANGVGAADASATEPNAAQAHARPKSGSGEKNGGDPSPQAGGMGGGSTLPKAGGGDRGKGTGAVAGDIGAAQQAEGQAPQRSESSGKSGGGTRPRAGNASGNQGAGTGSGGAGAANTLPGAAAQAQTNKQPGPEGKNGGGMQPQAGSADTRQAVATGSEGPANAVGQVSAQADARQQPGSGGKDGSAESSKARSAAGTGKGAGADTRVGTGASNSHDGQEAAAQAEARRPSEPGGEDGGVARSKAGGASTGAGAAAHAGAGGKSAADANTDRQAAPGGRESGGTPPKANGDAIAGHAGASDTSKAAQSMATGGDKKSKVNGTDAPEEDVSQPMGRSLFMAALLLVAWLAYRWRWRIAIEAALGAAGIAAAVRPDLAIRWVQLGVRMTLHRSGHRIQPGQSMREYVASASDLPRPARRWLRQVTLAYCACRFGGTQATAALVDDMRRAVVAALEVIEGRVPGTGKG